MTAMTIILGVAIVVLAVALLNDRQVRASRRRDRAVMRLLHTYMAKLPPARPW